jgi:phosphoserine aminotransferase
MLAGMATRVINFNPGPGALPLSALERAQQEMLDFEGTGMSILEHSHRGPAYVRVHEEALALLSELLDVPSSHRILLLQGGAHLQFAMLPLAFRSDTHAGDYVITGNWARKAYEEAARIGQSAIAADVEQAGRFTRVPSQAELRLSSDAPFVHVTSNNTIFGTQYRDFPETGAVPLVADMSSDLLSRRIDVGRFGLIYAAAQKNLGPAGVTVVIISADWLARARTDMPEILSYAAHARENSLYNTAPTFSIYMLRNVLQWSKQRGGLKALEAESCAKAELLYGVIDASAGFYANDAVPAARSRMNVVFRLPTPELDRRFVEEAAQSGMLGLKGHRIAGGIRASIYNAVPLAHVAQLADFMRTFRVSL